MDEHIEAVQRMQDYIEAHLDTNMTMADLARVSKYSPWYSYRLFCGTAPHDTCRIYPTLEAVEIRAPTTRRKGTDH